MKKEIPVVTLNIDANGSPQFNVAKSKVTPLEVVKPQKPVNLDGLAKRICMAHERVLAATCGAFDHAIRAGTLLIEAKSRIEHGKWLPWLEEHTPDISERTARVYVQVALKAQVVLDANRQSAADLTIRAALKLISKTRVTGAQKGLSTSVRIASAGDLGEEFTERDEHSSVPNIEVRNPGPELTVRAEFQRWARLLALEISQSVFRQLVEETCQDVYGDTKILRAPIL